MSVEAVIVIIACATSLVAIGIAISTGRRHAPKFGLADDALLQTEDDR